MVMRNRRDGGGSSGGWDDLPPRVRTRFAGGPVRPAARPELILPPADPAPPPAPGPAHVSDLTKLAVAVLATAAACLAVQLAALAFLAGGPLPVLGR